MEWQRLINCNGDPCGRPSADQDTVFNVVDTLENMIESQGLRLSFTRKEIKASAEGESGMDRFYFNGESLEELLGITSSSIERYTPDLILRAALAAVEREST
jgi:hypothetical protein